MLDKKIQLQQLQSLDSEKNQLLNPEKIRRMLLNKYKKSGFSSFDQTERDLIYSYVKAHPKNPIGLIAYGYICWSDNKYSEASQSFLKALKRLVEVGKVDTLKGFEIGITSYLPNLTNDLTVNSSLFFPKEENLEFILKSKSIKPKLTILSSCDEAYFNEYGSVFLALVQREYANFNVHLHVIYPSQKTLTYLSNVKIDNLSLTIEKGNEQPFRAYYASRRFLIAPALIDIYETNLLITDIDVLPLENFIYVISRLLDENFDLACGKFSKSWMPWNQFIVSQLFIKNSARSRLALRYVASYMQQVFEKMGSFEKIWWVDQNAMYFAVKKCTEKDGLKFKHIGSFGRLYLGPSVLGKSKFSSICKDYVAKTDVSWRFINPICDFAEKHSSDLQKDISFLKRILSSGNVVYSNNTNCLSDLMLKIFSSLSENFSSSLKDYVITNLIANKRYNTAFSLFNEINKTKNKFVNDKVNVFEENIQIEQFTGLFFRKNFDKSTAALAKLYKGSQKNTLNFFIKSSIREKLRVGNLKNALSEISEFFGGLIIVAGLQRSGTNYISELIRLNTNAYVHPGDSSIFWKHCLSNERNASRVNPIFSDPLDAIERLNAYCFVVKKNPLNWVESVTKRNPVDFFNTRKNYVKGSEDIEGIINFYIQYLESWKNISNRVFFVDYEAILSDPRIIFEKLVSINNIQRIADEIEIPMSVPFSEKFDDLKKEQYLEGKTMLSEENVELINLILSRSMLQENSSL